MQSAQSLVTGRLAAAVAAQTGAADAAAAAASGCGAEGWLQAPAMVDTREPGGSGGSGGSGR